MHVSVKITITLLSLCAVGLLIALLFIHKPWASAQKGQIIDVNKSVSAGDIMLSNARLTKITSSDSKDISKASQIIGSDYKLCAVNGYDNYNVLNINSCDPTSILKDALIHNARLVKIQDQTEKNKSGYIGGTDYRLCGLGSQDLNYNPSNSNDFSLDSCSNIDYGTNIGSPDSVSPSQPLPQPQPQPQPQTQPQPSDVCRERAQWVFDEHKKKNLKKTMGCNINSVEDARRWMSCRTDEIDANGKPFCPPFPGNDCQSLGCNLTPSKNISPQPDQNNGQIPSHLVGRNDNGKIYNLVDNYRARDFVEKFDVIVGNDKTHGMVRYQNQRLIAFPTNSSGEVQFRTDIDSVPQDGKRDAVRIESKKMYNGGLFILDAAHVPEGNSVWPSFWLSDVSTWPCEGEIDILEYVNSYGPDSSTNHSTLHTDRKCNQYGVPGISRDGVCGAGTKSDKNSVCTPCKGKNINDCAYEGCGVLVDEIRNSDFIHKGTAGYGFNKTGGVYICEWILDGIIKIWFFPRQYVDKYIPKNSTSIDTRMFPKPYVMFNPCPGSFKNLKIIVNTTLCGDWAGPWFDKGGAAGCNAFVADKANLFKEAYWLINSVKVFN